MVAIAYSSDNVIAVLEEQRDLEQERFVGTEKYDGMAAKACKAIPIDTVQERVKGLEDLGESLILTAKNWFIKECYV